MPKPANFWERLFYWPKPSNYLGMAYILGFTGFGCLIMGIIGDAFNRVLGLEPISWFLVAIGALVLGLWFWLEWSHTRQE